MTKIWFTAVAALTLAGNAWAVYRCKGPDGKTTYQEAPCESGVKVDVGTNNPTATSRETTPGASARDWKAELDAVNRQSAIRQAMERGEPAIGMTTAQLDQAMGPPSRANFGNYDGHTRHQLIYDRGPRTWYVYTSDGVVRSIQNGANVTAPKQPGEPCPGPLTLKNMETSASSNSLSAAEKTERLRQIHDLRMRCR